MVICRQSLLHVHKVHVRLSASLFFCGFIRFFTGKLRQLFQFRNDKLFIFGEQRRVHITYVYEVGKRHGECFVVSKQRAIKQQVFIYKLPKGKRCTFYFFVYEEIPKNISKGIFQTIDCYLFHVEYK